MLRSTTRRQERTLSVLEEQGVMSTKDVAVVIGIPPSNMRFTLRFLTRHGLLQRLDGWPHRWEISDAGRAWLRRGDLDFPDPQLLDGMVFSDGSVAYPPKCQYPLYQQTGKHKSFLEWTRALLPTPASVTGPHIARVNGKEYPYFLLKTPTHPCYASLRQRWYGTGKKAIPNDFQVNSKTMLGAYLGDGCSVSTTKCLTLGTYGYERQELEERLLRPLQSLGFSCALNSRNAVGFRIASMQDFLDFIGPCPVPVYSYKWKISDRW